MSYLFTKTVTKVPAFEAYLRANFPLFTGFNSDGDQFTLFTSEELSPEDEATLGQLVLDYVDPEFFLTLDYTECQTGLSKRCIGLATPYIVQSMIFPKRVSQEMALDALKTVIAFLVDDVSTMAEATSGIVTLSIYDYTRDMEIGTQNLDISDKVVEWATMAANNETGPVEFYQCIMFDGLINKSTDYDCIWQFKLSINNPNITVQMNGLQMLYYTVI